MPFLDLDPTTAIVVPVISDGAPVPNFGHTLAQLRGELDSAIGNRDDVTPAMLTTWINDAYLLIASGIKFKETKGAFQFTTVNDKYLYTLPAQVQYTTRASLIDSVDFPFAGGTPLDKIDEDTFRRLPEDTDNIPCKFFTYGNLFVVWPAGQGSSISVEYRIRPQPLVTDADSPILALEWHRGLLLKAKTFAYADLEEWDNRDRAQNDYVSFVREIGSPEAEEKTGQYAAFRRVNRRGQINRYGNDPRSREDW